MAYLTILWAAACYCFCALNRKIKPGPEGLGWIYGEYGIWAKQGKTRVDRLSRLEEQAFQQWVSDSAKGPIFHMSLLRCLSSLSYSSLTLEYRHYYPPIFFFKQRHYFANKGPYSQSYGFSSSYVWMWELDYKESWALKNRCFWTVVLEKTLESPLDCKEIKPVLPKGNHPEGLILKLKLHYFGHLMQRADSLEKTLMLRKIEGRRRGDDRG